MFKRLLVGYAGDRAGRDGVLLASRLSQLTGAAVSVAFPYHPLFARVSGELAEQRARDELTAMLPGDPLPAKARFHWSERSWPIRALHELAEFEAADLIIFGAAPERLGRRDVAEMERMVHGAPCAVAVAPDHYSEQAARPLARIGVGFADTEDARAAVGVAVELARLTGEPLRIVAGSGLSDALHAYAATSAALPQAEREMYEETRAAVQAVAREISLDQQPTIEVSRGSPCDLLIDASQTLDLLVLGSRAYGPLRHVLLGGVSAEVMRRAHCPVLVLPRAVSRVETATHRETAVADR